MKLVWPLLKPGRGFLGKQRMCLRAKMNSKAVSKQDV